MFFTSPQLLPYLLSGLLALVLFSLAAFHKLQGMALLAHGLKGFYVWLFLCLFISCVVEGYWFYLLHWLLAFLLLYGLWVGLMYISDKIGQPNMGDGGLAILIPIYLLPFFVFVSLLVRSFLFFITLF